MSARTPASTGAIDAKRQAEYDHDAVRAAAKHDRFLSLLADRSHPAFPHQEAPPVFNVSVRERVHVPRGSAVPPARLFGFGRTRQAATGLATDEEVLVALFGWQRFQYFDRPIGQRHAARFIDTDLSLSALWRDGPNLLLEINLVPPCTDHCPGASSGLWIGLCVYAIHFVVQVACTLWQAHRNDALPRLRDLSLDKTADGPREDVPG
jgi:hypothetical protein